MGHAGVLCGGGAGVVVDVVVQDGRLSTGREGACDVVVVVLVRHGQYGFCGVHSVPV